MISSTENDNDKRISAMDGRRDDDLKLFERVVKLETTINITIPRLEETIRNQSIDIGNQSIDIKRLISIADQNKGALFLPTIGITALITATGSWIIEHLWGK